MKTVHIKGYNQFSVLLRDLYKKFLINDPQWHFVHWCNFRSHKAFFEGEHLIIRISDEKILSQVQEFLNKYPKIQYEIYDFPLCKGKYQLGLLKRSWEYKNLDIALPMLHLLTLVFMRMGNGSRYTEFSSRYFHLMFNIRGWDHIQEWNFLNCLMASRSNMVSKMYHNHGKWN
jgi:hypothetical protein